MMSRLDHPGGSGTFVKRTVLRDGVYDAILEMLLDGRAAPGEALAIEGLARQLGVSPTPVREALAQLEHTGLVSRAALKGYHVTPPLSPSRMSELMDAREVIEVAAVRRAMPVGQEVLTELEVLSAQHRTAAQRVLTLQRRQSERPSWATLRTYFTVDWDFHRVFLRNCGNPYFLEMAEILAPHVHRLRQSVSGGVSDVEKAVAEHAVILEAAREGDPETTVAAMHAHLSGVRARAAAAG
jgi:DNA-binding GntR family transcriptional regulator